MNEEQVRAKGLELEAQMRLGAGLQGLMSYALQRAEDVQTGAALVNSPGQMAKLRLSMPGPSKRSFVSVEVLSMSSRRTLAGNTLNPATTANVTMIVPAGTAFELVGTVANLFNVQYADPASNHAPSGRHPTERQDVACRLDLEILVEIVRGPPQRRHGETRASGAELVGEVHHAPGRIVDGNLRAGFAGVGTVFVRARDMGGVQADGGCRAEVGRVRGDHHAFVGLEIECLGCSQIDAGLGLVIARDVGAQDRVPADGVAPGKIGHQRDVAVRAGRHQETASEAREAFFHIGPGVEPVPGEIEIGEDVLGKIP